MTVNHLKGKPRGKIKHYFEAEAELNKIVDDVNYRVALVLVEGIRDEEALRKVGLKRPVIRFCDSKLPVFAFVEEVANNYSDQTVLVLFDFDEEGKKMATRIGRELEERGVKIDHFVRNELAKLLVKEGIWRIEDVYMIKTKATY